MENDHPFPEVDVLFEDNHLLALNKPAGLLTQPGSTGGDSLEDRARHYVSMSRNKPGNVFLHAVHRLDRVASGIALFATTGKSLGRMNEQMRERRVTKIYQAVVSGDLPLQEGELVHFLRHSRLRSLVAHEHEPGARRSTLRYRRIEHKNGLTLVEIDLETGRYHQIRAQLAATGCPIMGDAVYGSRIPYVSEGIALHHRRMEFIHPVKKTPMVIVAGYPPLWPLFP